jgi:uncharacterized protein
MSRRSAIMAVPVRMDPPASGGPFKQEDLDGTVAPMRHSIASPRIEMDLADASPLKRAADSGVTRIVTLDARASLRHRLPDGRGFEIP